VRHAFVAPAKEPPTVRYLISHDPVPVCRGVRVQVPHPLDGPVPVLGFIVGWAHAVFITHKT
jgi:hypothetical protein